MSIYFFYPTWPILYLRKFSLLQKKLFAYLFKNFSTHFTWLLHKVCISPAYKFYLLFTLSITPLKLTSKVLGWRFYSSESFNRLASPFRLSLKYILIDLSIPIFLLSMTFSHYCNPVCHFIDMKTDFTSNLYYVVSLDLMDLLYTENPDPTTILYLIFRNMPLAKKPCLVVNIEAKL